MESEEIVLVFIGLPKIYMHEHDNNELQDAINFYQRNTCSYTHLIEENVALHSILHCVA